MEFLNRYGEEILQRSGQHLFLVVTAITIAVLIGIPLGSFDHSQAEAE